MKHEYDFLVVGAGLFGATFACMAKQHGKKCLVIDKRSHLGGNVYCEDAEGITVHKYGPHIFHTHDEKVWNFVNRFVSFNRFTLNTIANYKGKLYNLPFNMYTFYQMWGVTQPEEARRIIESQRREAVMENPANLEEQAIFLVGRDVYATLIKGYNVLIKGLLDGIEWRTGCNYLDDRAYFDGLADEIVYTGPIDEYFGWSLGFLEYRSLRFEQEMLPVSNYQGNAIVNYTERTVPYTRIVEHKHFEPGNGAVLSLPYTVVTREYPADYTPGSEAYYPVDNKRNRDLHAAYQDMGRCNVPHTWFAGRLGSYKYVDMGQAISSALKLSKALL